MRDEIPDRAPFLAPVEVGMCPTCRGVIRSGVRLAAPGGLAFTARAALECDCPPPAPPLAGQERPT